MTGTTEHAENLTLAALLAGGVFIDGDWVETKDQDPDGEVRLIQLADIGDGVFRDRSSRFLTLEKAKELRCTFLEPGDVLTARMPEPLGRACIFPGVGQLAVTVVDVCILRPDTARARPDWLVGAINAPAFRSAMTQFVRGTTRQRISRTNLGSLCLRVPDLASQAVIADALDRIDSKRATASRHIAAGRVAIERFRDAVLAAACSGRLTEDVRRDDIASDGEQAPASWQRALLGELAETIRGGSSKVPVAGVTEYPVLRSSSVRPRAVSYDDVRYLSSEQSQKAANYVQDGDLLITRLNGNVEYVGNAAVVDGLNGRRVQYPDRLFCLRLAEPAHAPFVELFLASPRARAQVRAVSRSAAGHQRISIADLKGFSIELPPLNEQREIVLRVNATLATAARITVRLNQTATALDRVFDACLAKAFRGELVPAHGALAEETGRDLESADDLIERVGSAQLKPDSRRGGRS